MNKTLKATVQALLEVVASEDSDMLDSFQASLSTESLKSTSSDPGARQAGRRRGQQQETETFYVTVGRWCWTRRAGGWWERSWAGVEGKSVSVTTVSFADVLYWCRHEPCPLLCSCHSYQKLHQPLGE